MNMKRIHLYFAGLIILLGSCYPDGPEYYEELDVVYTNYDEDFNFKSNKTYAMPDKIVKVTGNLAEGEVPEMIDEPYNTQILSRVESNLASLGWTRAEDPSKADVTVFPASWTNTTVYYWYDYWCWYYYYYCGWGYYYPVTTSYTTGTFVMTMISTDTTSVEPKPVWVGAINGLMSGAYDMSRIYDGIDQAFAQSPYLNVK